MSEHPVTDVAPEDTGDAAPPSTALERYISVAIGVLAVGLSIFQLWQPVAGFVPPGVLPFDVIFGQQPSTYLRPAHLSWVLILIFLYYPLIPASESRWHLPGRVTDLLLSAMVVWASVCVLTFDYKGIDHLLNGLSPGYFAAGGVLMILTLEAARRSVGWVMAAIGLLFLLYAAYGNVLPDALATRGFSFERIIRFQVFTASGLFGAPLGIAAGAVFMFVLFGALLEVTGAGKFFIDLAFAAAGKYRGGPAKASVLASAAMGSISGSAIANTVTTGSLTIPMMRKLGYRPEQAAGIEAAASTGGQIMPPIMGAGAFVMAEFTRTPYGDIVWISIVPALLYFGCTLLYVHLMACKAGLKGMEERAQVGAVIRNGAHFLLPLAFITALLLMNYSPVLVGAAGCAAIVAAAFLRRHTHIGFGLFFKGLRTGAMMAAPISAACAVAGIVVGVIGQTGIGLQFTDFVVSLAGGKLWLALALVALSALVLGMGLPVTAAYIVLAVMAAPALQSMGLALITAHMIIFWLSQTSNVTPPIALAAFAGAGVAGARPMKSAVEAFKLAKGFFIIPLMMAYAPLIATGDNGVTDVLWAGLVTAGLIAALAFAVEGYALRTVTRMERTLFIVAAILLLYPDIISRTIGLALLATGVTSNARCRHGAIRQTTAV